MLKERTSSSTISAVKLIDVQKPARKLFLAGLLILLIGISACSESAPDYFHVSGSTMGTSYSVKISQALEPPVAESLKQDIDAVLIEVNARLSTYQADSELSRFNSSQEVTPQPVSDALYQVLSAAQSISDLTHGAFDVTVGPLVNLWGFGPKFKPDQLPATEEITAAKIRTGFHQLTIDAQAQQIQKATPDLYVDLSAIAKGYGVDQVASLVERRGYRDYMVEIGGEVRGKGKNSHGKYWQIAIEKPLVGERTVQRIVPLDDIAIATSGDYRNFFEIEGVRYSHTIDPTTGWPVSHDLTSVTVLTDNCMLSDGWATAFMVLGAEKGYDLAVKQNLAVLFVRKTNQGFQEQATPAFESYLERVAQ